MIEILLKIDIGGICCWWNFIQRIEYRERILKENFEEIIMAMKHGLFKRILKILDLPMKGNVKW